MILILKRFCFLFKCGFRWEVGQTKQIQITLPNHTAAVRGRKKGNVRKHKPYGLHGIYITYHKRKGKDVSQGKLCVVGEVGFREG